MNNEKKIIAFLNNNNGYVKTSELVNLGISRSLIPKYIESKLLEKVSYGIYMDSSKMKDEYYIIQMKYPYAIFSYNTALHILNLTNRTPYEIDISIKRHQRIREDYNIHYVSDNYYDIGIIEVDSPNGNPIKVYNAERCICDMLRTDGEFDVELQNRVLDYYFNSNNKDIDKLLDYAKKFNIYDKVNTIVEVMMKW